MYTDSLSLAGVIVTGPTDRLRHVDRPADRRVTVAMGNTKATHVSFLWFI